MLVMLLSDSHGLSEGPDMRPPGTGAGAVGSSFLRVDGVFWPHDCNPPGPSVHGDSPGKNTGVGCHALLQGSLPAQGSTSGLPQCRQILYHRATRETHRETIADINLEAHFLCFHFTRGNKEPWLLFSLRLWTKLKATVPRPRMAKSQFSPP